MVSGEGESDFKMLNYMWLHALGLWSGFHSSPIHLIERTIKRKWQKISQQERKRRRRRLKCWIIWDINTDTEDRKTEKPEIKMKINQGYITCAFYRFACLFVGLSIYLTICLLTIILIGRWVFDALHFLLIYNNHWSTQSQSICTLIFGWLNVWKIRSTFKYLTIPHSLL